MLVWLKTGMESKWHLEHNAALETLDDTSETPGAKRRCRRCCVRKRPSKDVKRNGLGQSRAMQSDR